MSEQIGVLFIFVGLAVFVAGMAWGVLRTLGIVLRRREVRQLLAPLTLVAVGLTLGLVPFAAQRAYLAVVGLGERERVIDGERALNLTGWDRESYHILAEMPDVAILELGNPDVGDDTLDLVAALPALRELTLNDSAVTDAGLAKLARMPRLQSLRIARTKVTPEGVQRFLDAPPPRLEQIDVSGNGVPTAVLRRWKNAAVEGGGERRYVN
jgi:hypothetical protein